MSLHTAHRAASRYVASLRRVPSSFRSGEMALNEAEYHALEFKSGGHPVLVSFTAIRGDEDSLWMRSTNWRCEDEPCGKVTKAQARAIYRNLLNLGFTKP